MRRAGRLVAQTLNVAAEKVQEGISLKALEDICHQFILAHGGKPAFLGYRGFPGAVCISINDEVVHGIPDSRLLTDGDLVKIDVGVLKDGLYADGARTFIVGSVPARVDQLVQVTEQALYLGIQQARAGNRLSAISCAIQQHVEAHGFSVVEELSGHGIGIELHEEPAVPNFAKPGTGIRLKAGMTIAIEPMVNFGSPQVQTDANKWTVKTRDGLPSAHFEHTVLITNGAPEILTKD